MDNSELAVSTDYLRRHLGELTTAEERLAQAAWRLGAMEYRTDYMAAMEQLRETQKEAEADKARLDWLSERDNPIGNVQLPTVCVMNNLHNMRGAIDEAMRLDPEIVKSILEAAEDRS